MESHSLKRWERQTGLTLSVTLERCLFREIRAWWDVATLEKYLQLKMVPRGLRIKKFPTFTTEDKEFTTKWNLILTDCSNNLIQLLIDYKKETLVKAKAEMEHTQSELLKVATEEKYLELDQALNLKLKKEEDLIIVRKVKKFDRDRRDYDEGHVYTKRQPRYYQFRGPRSILKRTQQHKHVSFSSADDSYGFDEDTARSSFPVSSSPQSDRESLALEVFNDTSKRSFNGSVIESKNEVGEDYRRSQRTKEGNKSDAMMYTKGQQHPTQQQKAGHDEVDGNTEQQRNFQHKKKKGKFGKTQY
ncbi:hypothetical protein XELAEV_18005484mg [Xenopus laevis]|uniref:Uncharacterized protein n=1 Tax=Xenopus laevis TaxID=8355 RepID=A0A974DY96_XENLA|nr:hypothetical protein XELAEV_18005484mg [Xenopus laevis]